MIDNDLQQLRVKIAVKKSLEKICNYSMRICEVAEEVKMPKEKLVQAVTKFINELYIEE